MIEAPVINLNGSSAETMVADILAALGALQVATNLVAQTAPHPRDWQTVPDGAVRFRLAREQHLARMRHLNDILKDLEATGIAIQDQADARAKR